MTGLTVKELLLLFYADDGMIASRRPCMAPRSFDCTCCPLLTGRPWDQCQEDQGDDMPSRLYQNRLLQRQVQASHHWCRALATTTQEDCCYLPQMQQENDQGFPFGSHGENSWRALCGATRTSRSIPGLTSAQGLRHQLAPRAQEMEMPCGGLPLPSKHELTKE